MTAVAPARRRLLLAGLLVVAITVSAGMLIDLGTIWNRVVIHALAVQRDLHRELAAAMRTAATPGSGVFWSLIGLGFLYGVFHAVGPGHGKVVISTYLASHETRLGRGIALSVLSSLLQGVTAIAAVGATVTLLALLPGAQVTAVMLESASYGLVILLGVFLALQAVRRLLARSPDRYDHGARHCCHGHGSTTADLAAPPSRRHFVMTVLSVGLRPCSGAILVLALAFATDLVPAGVLAVLAMSLGTALTVAALAVLSVYARRTAIGLSGFLSDDGPRSGQILDGVAMVGGIAIVLFGAALLQASLATAHHPLL
jgi:nickel/cobalt transporter (NicO) family protein